MGKRNRSLIKETNLFYVTTTLKDWQPLFATSDVRNKAQNLLFSFFPDYAEALMGYVIMPSHIHCMIGCKQGGPQLSRMVGAFKSITAKKLFPSLGSVWMHRFDDLVVTSEKQFRVKLNYIHENPVRKGFVDKPEDWKWSSAQFWELNDDHPTLTKGWDWT
ncbi:MAG: transposase [Candidatus Electryonea clarkiae]|nr:transposase [Candidatus Electryonea clarkiae]MDP8287278.1 transposase [Candidatus Electryonea clarkiae]